MNENSFGVVIPFHNEEDYLESCIRSLLNQSSVPREIILVDNNSTDRSCEVIKNSINIKNNTTINIKLIEEKKPGVAYARDKGWRESESKFIIFADADEVFEPNFISNVENFIQKNSDVDFIAGTIKFQDPPWFIKFLASLDPIYQKINKFLQGFPYLYGACTVARRSALEKINGFKHIPGNMSEDWYLSKIAHRNNFKIKATSKIYAIHSLDRYHKKGLLSWLKWFSGVHNWQNQNQFEFDLNPIDASFLWKIDSNSYYLNYIFFETKLNNKIDKQKFLNALIELNNSYPELKLGSKLDLEKLIYFQESNRTKEFFKLVVHEEIPDKTKLINKSVFQYSPAFEFYIDENRLAIQMCHCVGDGVYLLKVSNLVLKNYLGYETEIQTKKSFKPLKILLSYPFKFIKNYLPSLKEEIFYKVDDKAFVNIESTTPFSQSSNTEIDIFDFDEELLTILKKICNQLDVTINTFLNVYTNYLLSDSGLLNKKTNYSFPTFLGRYNKSQKIRTHNFIANLTYTLSTTENLEDLKKQSKKFQEDTTNQLDNLKPLISVFNYNLFYKISKKSFLRENTKWFKQTFQETTSLFVISNLGKIDQFIEPEIKNRLIDKSLKLYSPILGGQPISILVYTIDNLIKMTINYDSERINKNIIEKIKKGFKIKNLEKIYYYLSK